MEHSQPTPPASRKYLLEFTNYQAKALVEYNADGFLIKFELDPGTFEEKQFVFMTDKFPKTIKHMQALISWKLPNVRISELKQDLSFEAFYNAYAYKVSKRSTAENAWKKLPDPEKAKAIAYIPVYDRFLGEKKINKKYPETYLNSEMWNN